MNSHISKINAAKEALKFVKNGMTVGLGTGSTARIFIDLLGKKLGDGFQIIGMPTSIETKKQATNLGIELIGIEDKDKLDIAIDGADEVSPEKNLIKGLGGALLREKLVEKKAKKLIIIVDQSKMVDCLGTGVLPVEVKKDNHQQTASNIELCGCSAELRINERGEIFETDNENYIYLCNFKNKIEKPEQTEVMLMSINGVVDTGLFLNMADIVIVGKETETKIIQ
ncbi:MAG: ribose 5-phosphate isomerase A [Candidatus Poseidoniales archaeon]